MSRRMGGSVIGDARTSVNGKNLENDQVSLSGYSFLFSELCTRAYNYPTKVRNVEEVEARLTLLGTHVGLRLITLSSLRDQAEMHQRPLTIDAALKLLQGKLWSQWFGKAASDLQRESNSDRFFIFDSDPLVLRFVNPSPDYIDSEGRWNVNYASFIGGVVQGALQSMGFDAEVITYHQPEDGKPHQSVFVIDFARHVWDRERKLKLEHTISYIEDVRENHHYMLLFPSSAKDNLLVIKTK